MIREIIKNDLVTVLNQKLSIVLILFLFLVGIWSGLKFNISLSSEISIDSPYNIGFIIGLLSLTVILIGTVLAYIILFKEQDANFSLIIFSTPISDNKFSFSRYISYFLLTTFLFFVLIVGFSFGIQMQDELLNSFNLWHYLYPYIIFGVFNSLFVTSIFFFIALKFQSKLLVAIGGVLIYVLYFVALIFSNAPILANALPQSVIVQKISALMDPFGLSSYFLESQNYTLQERNMKVIELKQYLLFNRLIWLLGSIFTVFLGVKSFSKLKIEKTSRKKKATNIHKFSNSSSEFLKVNSRYSIRSKWQSLNSFVLINTTYLFKSTALVVMSIVLLFYVGLDMYSSINKGIRLPEHFASSGLLAETIINNFYIIGGLAILYFVNDLFWRSDSSRFSIIQNTTYHNKESFIGCFTSITILIIYFTFILFIEAIIFQLVYNFTYIDWHAYFGVFVFNTLPLILFSSLLILINLASVNKKVALVLSLVSYIALVLPLANLLFDHPFYTFLTSLRVNYSDFNGYGAYLNHYIIRLIFGFSFVSILFWLFSFTKTKKLSKLKLLSLVLLITLLYVSSKSYTRGYIAFNKHNFINEKVNYELNYRSYKSIAQPTIKKVSAYIELNPKSQSYKIEGSYKIVNQSLEPINSILLNSYDKFKVKKFVLSYKDEVKHITSHTTELKLENSIQPGDSAKIEFEFSYNWNVVNKHDPFNSIISNGSFLRISRYLPYIGYDSNKEITDLKIRNENDLGNLSTITSLDSERKIKDDFIDLDMIISTQKDQAAIGTGTLSKSWIEGDRKFVKYSQKNIPFRFALASASYSQKSSIHNGIKIKVLYNPSHTENVDNLIYDIKLSLDYCIKNFGEYPFDSLQFVEVSSFTKGFNGTAYPGVIFMTEDMAFNANVSAKKEQDVINELAGHEIAHFWWGNNQIDPDYREGYAFLTESLAMYTEMMIFKEKYGRQKMLERLKIHKQIYETEKGFHEPIALSKATKELPHISYSKGALVLVEISDLIGEDNLNLALRNFLVKFSYPSNLKPISTDLVNEIINVSDISHHQKITKLITLE